MKVVKLAGSVLEVLEKIEVLVVVSMEAFKVMETDGYLRCDAQNHGMSDEEIKKIAKKELENIYRARGPCGVCPTDVPAAEESLVTFERLTDVRRPEHVGLTA